MPPPDSARPSEAARRLKSAGGAFVWGSFRLDLRSRQLQRDGVDVPLAVRHVALLEALVSRAGRTVTRDELIQTVWPRSVH